MSTLDMEWIWTKCHMLSSCSISLLKLTFTVSQSWTAGGWWIETSLKPRVNRTLKTCSVQVIYERIMCTVCKLNNLAKSAYTTSGFARQSAKWDTRMRRRRPENTKSRIRSLESGIIEIENEDGKTSLQQCVMNKYQFSISPAEKLLLTLIEYWAICLMIGHPPFRGIDWSVRAFASMRAVPPFIFESTSSDQFSNASSEHFRNYKWRATSTSLVSDPSILGRSLVNSLMLFRAYLWLKLANFHCLMFWLSFITIGFRWCILISVFFFLFRGNKTFYPPGTTESVCNLFFSVYTKVVLFNVATTILKEFSGADPGEVKWVNSHPHPLFLSPLLSFFCYPSNIEIQYLISLTLLQKFTPHFKILGPPLVLQWLINRTCFMDSSLTVFISSLINWFNSMGWPFS